MVADFDAEIAAGDTWAAVEGGASPAPAAAGVHRSR
jgi:hypothetical protein